MYTVRQKRFYSRAMSGMRVQGTVRLVTLTSSPDSPSTIHSSFRILKERIRRRGGFEYLAVRELTKSGLQHLHILYRGKDLDGWWLSRSWKAIHNAEVIFIRRVSHQKGVASYLAKYLAKDMNGRYYSSWRWIYRGWRMVYKFLWSDRRCSNKKASFFLRLACWDEHLKGRWVWFFGVWIPPPRKAELLYLERLEG